MRTTWSSTRPRTKATPPGPSYSRHSRGQTSHCTRSSSSRCQNRPGTVKGSRRLMSAVMAPPAPTIGVQRSVRTDERGPGSVPYCRSLRATGLAIPATACSWWVLPPLRLLTGRRNRRDGRARPALAGHLELAHLQRADLDLLGAQCPDHRVGNRKPADGDRADRGDGERQGTHRGRPEDAGADSHRAGDARRRGGGAAPLVTDADDACWTWCLLWLAGAGHDAGGPTTAWPSRPRCDTAHVPSGAL